MDKFIFWLLIAALFYFSWRDGVKPTSMWAVTNIEQEFSEFLNVYFSK